MILTDARTKTLLLLNDDNTRYSEAIVDGAIEAGLNEILAQYSDKGGTLFDQQSELSVVSGSTSTQDLSAMTIKSVERKIGNNYAEMFETSHREMTVSSSDSYTVRVTYVGRPTFPTVGTEEITYGIDGYTNSPIVDQLMCLRAASMLIPADGEVIPGIAQLEDRLFSSLMLLSRQPLGRIMAPSNLATTFVNNRWCYRPHTLSFGSGT